jgi:hypothetical protein
MNKPLAWGQVRAVMALCDALGCLVSARAASLVVNASVVSNDFVGKITLSLNGGPFGGDGCHRAYQVQTAP